MTVDLCDSSWYMSKDWCYHLPQEQLPFDDARDFCLGNSAVLAPILTNETVDFLQELR